MRVRPTRPGAVIRDPRTRRRLPAAGGRVPDSTFWRRRLISGDVELVPETVAPSSGDASSNHGAQDDDLV
jgi:hypothetical protein